MDKNLKKLPLTLHHRKAGFSEFERIMRELYIQTLKKGESCVIATYKKGVLKFKKVTARVDLNKLKYKKPDYKLDRNNYDWEDIKCL